MKLEIRDNFDNEYAEMKRKVSKTNPLLGILIGEVEKNGRKSKSVLGVAADDLIFHTVLLTETTNGPIIMIDGQEGNSDTLFLTYYETPQWVKLE